MLALTNFVTQNISLMRKLLFTVPMVMLLAAGCSSPKVTTQAPPPTGNFTYSGSDFFFQYPSTMTVRYPSTMSVSDTIYTSHGEPGCGSAWANSSYCLYLDPATTAGTASDPLYVFVYKTNATPIDFCNNDLPIRLLGNCMSTEINGYPAAENNRLAGLLGSDTPASYYSFISHNGTLAIIHGDDSNKVALYTIEQSISFHN